MIVLSTTPFGEKGVVVHTLSREYGRRGFLASVGKSASMSRFMPLSIIQAQASVNTRSQLWRIHSVETLNPLLGIRTSMEKNAISVFMSEVLFRVVHEGAPDEALFDWCLGDILTLNALEGNFASYHIRFLLELAVHLGFSPEASDLAPFAGEYYSKLSQFISSPLDAALILPMSGTERTEIASAILRYLEYHTESSINIRSLQVLHELFAYGA